MNPRSPRRIRRALLILGACWIVLSTAWVARRWWAVNTLQKAVAAGEVRTRWAMPSWVESRFGSKWGRLWPGSRLNELYAQPHSRGLSHGKALARAVRVCGPLGYLNVTSTPGVAEKRHLETREFLLHLGSQRNVQTLVLVNVALPEDDIATLLGQFPKVITLSLVSVPFSGRRFPLLAALEQVRIESAPFSDEGLAALLRCPALRLCRLDATAITHAGLRQLPQWKQKFLKEFWFSDNQLTKEQRQELQTILKAACPDLGVTVSDSRPID